MYPKTPTFDVALKSTERQWVQKIPEVYTNDLNSVSIQFKITDCTDTELTGSTAIVLLKMRDGSFFQGPSVDVTRTLNVFSYTLKENEGNHDGLAEIQLIVTVGTKKFATQKYNFKVITGLDSEVAREIMIYDWSTLTAEARAYIDQFTADEVLRDAEFDNNQFDRNVEFNAAQGQRDTDFGLAQTQRNTDFETDQAQRVSDFNAAEAARVLAFNNAETDRAAGYDADHSRAGTDHTGAVADRANAATDRTNAATDRTNAAADRTLAGTDHTMAESDHTRANADNATVAGFNGRLTDVEADTSFDATNLVTNGNFANGTTGWTGNTATISASANECIVTPTTLGPAVGAYRGPVSVVGNKVYVSGEIYSKYPTTTTFGFSGGENFSFLPTPNAWSRKSGVVKANPALLYYYHAMNTGGYLITDTIKLRNLFALDLTAIFGAGKEPTAAEMDRILARFTNSWFDGTKNLFQAKASLNKLMALDARTEFEAKNGVINGNFSNGIMGWAGVATSLTALGNGTVNAAPTALKASVEPSTVTTIPAKNGNKIYMASYIKSSPDAANERLMVGAGNTQILLTNNKPLTHPSGALLSTIGTLSGQTDGRMITAYVTNGFLTEEIAGVSSFSFGYVTLIDLTATFGAGKEPTLAEMDRLMARFPNSWFDGVKPIQTIETLYQEKANKVQEAWITPTLLNGFTEVSGYPVRYMKDELGFVHLKGKVQTGSINADIFKLPVGYRTMVSSQFLVPHGVATSAIRLWMSSLGEVRVDAAYTASVDLSGITFRAEA